MTVRKLTVAWEVHKSVVSAIECADFNSYSTISLVLLYKAGTTESLTLLPKGMIAARFKHM